MRTITVEMPVEVEETTVPKVIGIEATPEEAHLSKMIRMVKEGHWTKNRLKDEDAYCTLGMLYHEIQ